jgi:hypothetical protein
VIRNHDSDLPRVLEDLLDDILDDLVREYDDEELPLRREVTYHEAIVEERGDRERAEARAAAFIRALEDTHDVVSLQTKAAIHPETLGVSTQTQRIAIGVGQADFRTAVGRYCAAYRQAHQSTVDITLSPTHTNYAATYNFPGWTARTDQDEATSTSNLRMIWNKRFDDLIATMQFDQKFYVKPGIIAAVVACICFFISPLVGKATAAIAAINVAREPAIDKSISMYRDAVAEFVDAEVISADLDSQESDLIKLIDGWPTATPAMQGVAS